MRDTKVKKIQLFVFLVSIAMLALLSACGGNESPAQNAQSSPLPFATKQVFQIDLNQIQAVCGTHTMFFDGNMNLRIFTPYSENPFAIIRIAWEGGDGEIIDIWGVEGVYSIAPLPDGYNTTVKSHFSMEQICEHIINAENWQENPDLNSAAS